VSASGRAPPTGCPVRRIELDDFGIRTAARALPRADQVGDHVRFDFGGGDTLLLVDVDLRDLGAADFIL
jgi:hypothetical protein